MFWVAFWAAFFGPRAARQGWHFGSVALEKLEGWVEIRRKETGVKNEWKAGGLSI
jgi:hypothetical protein